MFSIFGTFGAFPGFCVVLLLFLCAENKVFLKFLVVQALFCVVKAQFNVVKAQFLCSEGAALCSESTVFV